MRRGSWKRLQLCAIFVFLAILFLGRSSSAQTSQAPANTVTLAGALNYALEHYPAVRASLDRVAAARAGVTLARTAYLPQLDGAYQASRATQNQAPGVWLPTAIAPAVEGPLGGYSGQSYWGSQALALFSWEPVDFGLRAARVNQARTAADESQADLAVTRLQVACAVAGYFLQAVAGRQTVKTAQANVERWQVFDESVRVLADNELRPGADAARADAELARARTELYVSQQAESAALDTLAALMGAAGSAIQLDAGPLLASPSSESLPEAAASRNPLAQVQMAAVRQLQAEEKVLRRTDYPRLYLQAAALGRGSEVLSNGTPIGNANGLGLARGNWVTGISILFPDVFDFKSRGAEEQIAKAGERSQQARYDQTLQDLSGEISAARDRWKAARLVAQETPTELAAAREAETQSRARYQSGLATVVEVAEAENLLAAAESDDAIARLNVWRGLFAIACAQGDLGPFLRLLEGQAGGH